MSGWRDWPSVVVHPSQQPELLDAQLAEAMRSRRLPAKAHYLTPRQARRWLGVHDAFAPSGGAVTATTEAYREVFVELAGRLRESRVQIVGLGCGGGHKDALLARALSEAGCSVRYLAVDAGQALVLEAARAVEAAVPGMRARRLVADLDALGDWRDFIEAVDVESRTLEPELQIVCAFGIIPNADAPVLIERLARWLKTGDRLLLSANLHEPGSAERDLRAIVPQYDNQPTREWLATFFADLDWPVQPRDLIYEVDEDASPARIRVHWIAPEALQTTIGSSPVRIAAGERFEVFFTNRFEAPALTALLTAQGLADIECTETARGVEAVWSAVSAWTDR